MYLEKSKNSNKIEYLLIAMFPILSLYDLLPLVNIGYFMLLSIIIFELIKSRLTINLNLEILLIMIILISQNLIIGVIKYLDVTSTINNSAGMILFTGIAIFLCYPDYLEKEKLYEACRIVGLIATGFLIYQFVAFYFFGIIVKGDISILNSLELGFESINYGRPTSFFYEPAHYIIYIAPIYAMSIIKKDYIVSLIFMLGMFMSTSTTGLIFALAIPLIINIKKAKSIIYIIIIGVIVFILVNNLQSLYGQYFNKLDINNLMVSLRLFGTVSYFQYFSTSEWIFGLGINKLAEFIYQKGNIETINYANSLIFLVFSFGILGTIVWSIFCIRLYTKTDANYKVIWYIFMFILVSDQILFNRNLLYLLIWVYAVSKKHTGAKKSML